MKKSLIIAEFWLGLRNISSLTSSGTWQLMVELQDHQGRHFIALYNQFRVDTEGPYRLHVSGYDVDTSTAQDSLTNPHHGMAFSTSDNDNDLAHGNCAERYLGAWWYNSCLASNLNGFNFNQANLTESDYAKGITWQNDKHANCEPGAQDQCASWSAVQMIIQKLV